MARDLTAAVKAEIGKRRVSPIILVRIDFNTGTVRVWSGIGDLLWNGDTYNGVGDLGSIGRPRETTEIQAEGISFELSGIPSSNLSLALQEARRNKPAKAWLGFMDDQGNVIADPFMLFSGRVDSAEIEEGGETATVRVIAESILARLQTPNERRYTDEDQKIDYPADKGLEFVASLQDKQLVWGS